MTEPIENEEVNFDLNIHIHRLLMDEPFFAALSRRMDKRATKAVSTAGVTVTEEGKLQLVYNSQFMGSLSDDAKKDVLKHEFYHIVFQHVTGNRFMSFRDMAPNERKIHNIAMDLSINGHLPNLPEGACFPGKGIFAELEPYQTAEWYLKKLREMQKDQPQGEGEGGEGGDPGANGEGGGQGQGQQSLDGLDSFDDQAVGTKWKSKLSRLLKSESRSS